MISIVIKKILKVFFVTKKKQKKNTIYFFKITLKTSKQKISVAY